MCKTPSSNSLRLFSRVFRIFRGFGSILCIPDCGVGGIRWSIKFYAQPLIIDQINAFSLLFELNEYNCCQVLER